MLGLIRKSLLVVILTSLAICLGSGFSFAITWTPNFQSSTHTVSESSPYTTVTASWNAMTPTDGKTADSYTYVWDNNSDTTIDARKDPTEAISGNLSGLTVSRALSSGTWYLHMRAVDSGSNWTGTEHFGPIIVESNPAPIVSKIEPASDVNSSSTTSVTITGEYFKKLDDSDFTSVTASIGITALSNPTVVSPTQLTATFNINNYTAGSYDVKVTTDWGTGQLTGGFTVTNPAPTVTSISPTSAANNAEKTVTISGTGFLSTETTPPGTDKPKVEMKDPDNSDRNFTLTAVSVIDTYTLTAKVPSGYTPGTYDVVVTNSDSKSGTLTDGFQVKLAGLTITAVSPDSGTNDKTTSITITGTDFQTSGTTLVTLEATEKDTISCTSVNVESAYTITAVVPKEKAIGTYDLKVTNPDAQYAIRENAFTVKNPVATVESISPSSMTNDSTQGVTIVGTNFRTGVTVKIGTTACTGVSLDDTTPSTKLTCTVPADIAPGTYDVTVTNVGAEAGIKTDAFTVNAGTTTASVTYTASDTEHVPAGDLTITATFTTSQSAAPAISISLGETAVVTDQDMTATEDDKIWTYTYTVLSGDDTKSATVTIKSSAGTAIEITSGSTFTVDAASLSASITYQQGTNTTGPFKAGDLTITATLSATEANAPKISIDQQGTTDITAVDTSGSGTTWTYTYTVNTKDGTTYKDGTATVSLKKSDGTTTINIGSGGTFTIDTTGPTVALTYAQGSNTSSPFTTGTLAITATFSESLAVTPTIAINQPGTTDIDATDMQGSGRVWTHTYTVHSATETGYEDGTATVTIASGEDVAGNSNQAASNNTFTIDTTVSFAKGDADGSGTIDATDALYILHYVAGNVSLSQLKGNCDVDNSGTIDATDALYVLHYVAGNISSFD